MIHIRTESTFYALFTTHLLCPIHPLRPPFWGVGYNMAGFCNKEHSVLKWGVIKVHSSCQQYHTSWWTLPKNCMALRTISHEALAEIVKFRPLVTSFALWLLNESRRAWTPGAFSQAASTISLQFQYPAIKMYASQGTHCRYHTYRELKVCRISQLRLFGTSTW